MRCDDHEAAVGIFGREYHSLRLDAFELAGGEVGDEAHLFAHEFLGTVMLGDARYDGAATQSVVDFELQELVGFGNLLAFEHLAHANVEFGEVVEFDGRSDGFGYMVGLFVGDFGVVKFFDLGVDDAVVDFLEEQLGLCQLGADGKNDVVALVRKYAAMGADYIMVHFGVDQKREHPDASPLETLRIINETVDTPLSFAVYDAEEAIAAVENGADVIVVGEPLLSAPDPEKAMKEFIDKVRKGRA